MNYTTNGDNSQSLFGASRGLRPDAAESIGSMKLLRADRSSPTTWTIFCRALSCRGIGCYGFAVADAEDGDDCRADGHREAEVVNSADEGAGVFLDCAEYAGPEESAEVADGIDEADAAGGGDVS